MQLFYKSIIIIIGLSYFEIEFVNKKLKKNSANVTVKTKKSKIDNENIINFTNSKIEFTSINIDEDIIDIFLLHNSKRVISNTANKNYYRITAKDIGVKDNFQDIVCNVVNDIEITISIKFKNKFSSGKLSMKDKLKLFNQGNTNQKKPTENRYIPKKLAIPNNFLNRNIPGITPKPPTKKAEVPKIVEEKKKIEEPKKEEEQKKVEEIKKVEEQINDKEPKKIEESKKEGAPKKVGVIKNGGKIEKGKKKEEIKKDEVKKEDVKKEEIKKEEIKKDEVEKEEVKKEEDKKEETNKEEIKNEDIKNEDIKKEEVEKEEVKKEEIKKDEDEKEGIKKEDVKKEEDKKEEIKKEEIKNEEVEKEEVKKEEIKKDEPKKEVNTKENNVVNNQKNELKNEANKKPEEKKIIKKLEKLEPLKEMIKEKSKEAKETNYSRKLGGFEKLEVSLMKTKTLAVNDEIEYNDEGFVIVGEDFTEDIFNEIFLKPKKYTEYLEEQHKKNIKQPYRETFCEGFFIASFPKQNANVIELDTSFKAQCQHEECSKLPGMKPEIIFRYPLEDTKTLELNNLAATICFPTGIKVCYEEIKQPKEIKDYVTSITNQKGKRYYMMTYHFYLRMDTEDYNKQYKENPLKYNLRKFGDAFIGLSEEELTDDIISLIQDNLQWNQELANREIVSIPFCICLISKYPYVQEMKACLKSIYTILNNDPSQNSELVINDVIMYLINSIPIPAKNTKVKFLVPFSKNCIELDCPKLDDINIMNLSATHLLRNFTIDNLIIIFKLLIFEKKILLIDNDYEKLSAVADGLVSILYPFQWVHTYIPIMSDQMLKYLETFLPFLNGINESLMSSVVKVFSEGEIEEDDEVFLIYIRENKIKLSSTLRGKTKKFEKYIQDTIPSIPFSLEKELKNKLKKVKSRLDEIHKYKKEDTIQNRRNLELQIRDAFIDVFVEMFQDYAKYLSFVDQDAVFNKALFLEKKSKSEKRFYNDIIDTQLFQQFTQNVINEDVGYFNNKIALKEQGKKSKKKEKKPIPTMDKEYLICPEFLKLKISFDSNSNSLLKELRDKYPENTKHNSVLIMEKQLDIKNENYKENNCDIYFTLEELASNIEKPTVTPPAPVKETKNLKKISNNAILAKIKELNLKVNIGKKEKKEEMSEKDKESIKESIKDVVVQIFQSEEITLDQKNRNELLNKLNLPIGREFFISLLSKNDINIILLNNNSLSLLWSLIYNSLLNILKLEETNKILEETALLIKSTKYFGIQENNQIFTLFDKNIVKFQDLPKIRQVNFWQKWYDVELKKNENNKDDVQFKQNIIYDICKTLISLELPKSMVKNFTDSINIKEFGKGSELQVETFKTFIKFITSANYISKAF